jgi:LmbE family N-acetylglucosaminyl deacetylase
MSGSPLVSEIVVVDNGSDDETAAVAERAGARVVVEPQRGFGRALKTGFMAATGEIIFKLDADMRNSCVDWVAQHVDLLDRDTGVVKAYWSSGEDPMPVTNLVVRPALRRFFPALAGIHMPIAGVYLTRKSFLDVSSMTDGWPYDLEVIIRAHRAGLKIRQLYLGEVRDTLKPISAYHTMASDIISFLVDEGGAPPTERILFLMAHADDVEIWCGGTLLKYLAIGTPVTLVVLTGDERRAAEVKQLWGDHPLVELVLLAQAEFGDHRAAATQNVASIVRRVRPTLIVTHHRGDVHPDHRRCVDVLHGALLLLPRSGMPRRVLSCNSYFERMQPEQSFRPDVFVDVTVEAELKYRTIGEYVSQEPAFWIEMAKRIDSMNGYRSGVAAAEAFETWSFYNSPAAAKRLP